MWHATAITTTADNNSDNNNNWAHRSKVKRDIYDINSNFSVGNFFCRRDLISSIVSAGCAHLAIKIFRYLDSTALYSCFKVSPVWRDLIAVSLYDRLQFRRNAKSNIFSHGRDKALIRESKLFLSLEAPRGAVIDLALDEHALRLFVLASTSGRPHVMVTSLFGDCRRQWTHRFNEHFPTGGGELQCIAARRQKVAFGGRDGKVYIYEFSERFKCLRLNSVIEHHSAAVHEIIFVKTALVSCSDDMTIGVIDGKIRKRLHGHVSRIRAVDAQGGKIISGSDDRSVKLWSLTCEEKPRLTLTGHSGPVCVVRLCSPYALSAAGATVRLWNVENGGTCLKLLQHDDVLVTAVVWIASFEAVATADANGLVRCFDLESAETSEKEIVTSTSTHRLCGMTSVRKPPPPSPPTSPRQSPKTYNRNLPSSSPWWDDVLFKLVSIPHKFFAFSLSNSSPTSSVTIHCLDFIT